MICSPCSTYRESVLNQEELWGTGTNSSLLDLWFKCKKYFSWSERMADVNIVIILINMTQLTLELDFICQIASLRLKFHDANHSGTSCFPELVSCSGMGQICLIGHHPLRVHQIEGSHYMLPREYIPGRLCSSAGSTGTSRPRRTRCGTWSAGGGCPLSLGSRQEENTFSKCCYHRTMKTSFLPATGVRANGSQRI